MFIKITTYCALINGNEFNCVLAYEIANDLCKIFVTYEGIR